jgi:hypothetical protein
MAKHWSGRAVPVDVYIDRRTAARQVGLEEPVATTQGRVTAFLRDGGWRGQSAIRAAFEAEAERLDAQV